MLSCCCCCRGRPGQKGKILLQDPKADSSTAGRQNSGSQQQPDGKYRRKKLEDDVAVQIPAAQATPALSAVPVSAAKAAPSAAEPRRSSDSTDHRARTAVALVENQPVAKIRPTSVIPLRSGPPVAPQSSSFMKTREPHEHQHGYSVFQSDDNEVTIVDSDYSDYESEHEDTLTELAGREFGQRSTATLSLVMPRERRGGSAEEPGDEDDLGSRKKAERLSTFLLAREADCDNFGWETLPNSALEQPLPDDEEVIVVASKSSAAADTSTTAPYGLGVEDDPAARESLLALDQALAVFELASSEPADQDAVGVRVSGPGANPIADDSEVVIVPTATRNSKLIN